jgi:hypothetical protein
VVDALAAADAAKRIRALHFFGRAVDFPAAPPAGGPPTAIPAPHRDDALWLSLFDRVLAGVLACVRVPLGAAVVPPPPATAPAPAPASDPVALSQTALSVVRKLFRNCLPYVAPQAGAVLGGLLAAFKHAPKELAVVLDRTVEEVADKLPPDSALTVRCAPIHARTHCPFFLPAPTHSPSNTATRSTW